MRRPLFAVAICLVIIATLRLRMGPPINISKQSDVHVIGQIYQLDQKNLYLQNVKVNNQKSPGKMLCEILPGYQFALGNYVEVCGDITPFSEARNQGEFDARLYYGTLGIYSRLQNATLIAVSREHWPMREYIRQFKETLQTRIRMGLTKKQAGIVEALLLGERGNLDPDIKDLYQRNGIYHILSISSLHITMIGMFLYHILRRVGLPTWLAGIIGMAVLLLYGTMTGWGVSVIRAIGMYAVKMLGQMVGRTYDMLTALGLLGGVMVTINPHYLENGGFLLSFTCVLGIGMVFPVLEQYLEQVPGTFFPYKWMGTLAQSFVLSLSIFLSTLPLQLRLYYEVSVYSVLLNLIIIPLMQPLMICSFLLLIFPVLGIFDKPIYFILEGYEILCKLFEKFPANNWNPGCPSVGQVIIYYLLLAGGLWLLKSALKRKEDVRPFPIAISCLGLVIGIIFIGLGPDFGVQRNQVTFLDVGQGDGIFLQTKSGEHYLFDCGSSNRKQLGQYVLMPFLKYHGVSKLDAVFVSHPDMDHMSGIEELLDIDELEICQIILPDVIDTQKKEFHGLVNARTRYLSAGDFWNTQSATFRCLYPPAGIATEHANDYSQCFFINFDDGWSLLLMGDLESEAAVLGELRGRIEDNVVLKVAHHGSRNGTSKEFLREVRPDIAVISAGVDNRYGHPHKEVLDRLEEMGVRILSTAEGGQVTVRCDTDGQLYLYHFVRIKKETRRENGN